MITYENNCVDCPTEMGCLGCSCPYKDSQNIICDNCRCDNANYRIDGYDFCEECAKKYFQDAFDGLTISEQATILDFDYYKYR